MRTHDHLDAQRMELVDRPSLAFNRPRVARQLERVGREQVAGDVHQRRAAADGELQFRHPCVGVHPRAEVLVVIRDVERTVAQIGERLAQPRLRAKFAPKPVQLDAKCVRAVADAPAKAEDHLLDGRRQHHVHERRTFHALEE